MTDQQILILTLMIGGLLVFCAVPVIIAFARGHADKRTIAKLSPLAIFSFALWFALIVWAATDKRDDSIVSRWIERAKDRNMGPWIVGGLVAFGMLGAIVATTI